MTLLYIVGMNVVSWCGILCVLAVGLACFIYSSPRLEQPPATSADWIEEGPRPRVDKLWLDDDVGTPPMQTP